MKQYEGRVYHLPRRPSPHIQLIASQRQPPVPEMYDQVHVPHFANLMPYRQFLSLVYVPPMAMPGYSSNPTYTHPSNANSYLLMPGGSSHLGANRLKHGIQLLKPVLAGSPTGFGNFTNPTGYAINAPSVVGSATGLEDSSRNPRELPGLQYAPYYNMPAQTPHAPYMSSHTGHASFNVAVAAAQSSHMQFHGLYHSPPQPAAMASPHHLGPTMGGNVGVGVVAATPGPQVDAYQQPQLGIASSDPENCTKLSIAFDDQGENCSKHLVVDNLVSLDVGKQEDNYRAQVQLLSLKFDCRNKGVIGPHLIMAPKAVLPNRFELMDPRETRIGKVGYARVRTSQEQLKFAGTLHPSPEVTKTLNNREPRKVPKKSRVFRDSTPARQSQSRPRMALLHGRLVNQQQFANKKLMLLSSQSFGEDISHLEIRRYVRKRYHPTFQGVSNRMKINLNVLGTFMKNKIGGNLNSTSVLNMKRCRSSLRIPKLLKKTS
ncbi:hypothetical protein CK203_063291 [Vitis vinifera]|nr:hypothetical protein CK203_063291 [Vitis vinifera]